MITRAVLVASIDPGHGGLDFSYRIERRGDQFQVRAQLHQAWPAPGVMHHQPRSLSEELVKDRAEVETFMQKLADECGVFELGGFETLQTMLHPSSYRFRFEDAAGRVNEFHYRIECGKPLDAPHAMLVREFERFFDKPRLLARFSESAAPEAHPVAPPGPWWKFWSRR